MKIATGFLPLLLAPLALAACASNPRPYPADWPALAPPPADGCADVSGVYEAAPLRSLSWQAESRYGAPTLDALFTGQMWPRAPERVEVTQTGAKTLHVRSFSEGAVKDELRLDAEKGDWSCKSGFPEVTRTRTVSQNVAALDTTTRAYRKDAAGNLVVMESGSSVGCAMCLLPFSFREILWFVYPPAKKE